MTSEANTTGQGPDILLLNSEVAATQGADSPVFTDAENALLASVEARLADEVRRLVSALNQFGSRAQLIGKELPDRAEFCKSVTLLLALCSLQLSNALTESANRFVFADDGREYLRNLGLSLKQAFLEIDLDGRRFLAVSLIDQQASHLFGSAQAGEQHSNVHGSPVDVVNPQR